MYKDYLEKLYQYIDDNRDNIIEDLIKVCRIESVTNEKSDVKPFGQSCRNVLDYMLAKGEEEGFVTHNYEYYVGSVKYNLQKEKRIGILAHLDVVPAGDDWTITKPYEPLLKDGMLFGRGTGDDKSGAIAGLYFMKACRDLGIPLRNNIEMLLGTNEETGMKDVKYYGAHYDVPDFTFVPDAGFPGAAGEFGRIRYVLTSQKALSDDFIDMHAGSAFNIVPNKAVAVLKKDTVIDWKSLPEDFDVTETEQGIEIMAHGVTTHAAGPERGVNAIMVLTNALQKLDGVKEEDRKILEFFSNINNDYYGSFLGIDNTDEVSGQTVSSGTVLKFNEGHVSLLNDCRYCVTDNGDRLEENIRKKAAEWGFDVTVEEKSYGYHLDVNGPIIQTIKKVYEEYTGHTDREIMIGKGGTYAGALKNAFATGCIYYENWGDKPDFLPEGHGGAHQPDEFIVVDNYIKGIKLLATMILAVDEVL
ncbi:MAG: Sapep family Mn(2+)-dependent dipeptidase [Erysipelotrichaceae bacterium]|nr:Sapep family Mn(2+)-dependent dipeptidase [Erysipelotrichaceae bacterium]